MYVFTTSINYPNNTKLAKQNIKIDKDYMVKEIEIVDEAGIPQMVMKFKEVDLKADFDDNHFALDKIIENSNDGIKEDENEQANNSVDEKNKSEDKTNSNNSTNNDNQNNNTDTSKSENKEDHKSTTTSSIGDVIFPLYIPTGTTLTDQEKVSKLDGERVILTFDGEKPFLLVEETASTSEEFSIVPTYGEPYMLASTVGALTSNSLTWVNNGVEYYLVSDAMSQVELIEIASSISAIPTMK